MPRRSPGTSAIASSEAHDDQTPDGFVYYADRDAVWLCSHCEGAPERVVHHLGDAWEALIFHLQFSHGVVRSWVERYNPDELGGIQLGMTFVRTVDTSAPSA